MSKVSVLDQGWIDLVFEGRNQSYGAYQLRKEDSKTTLLALFSGIGVIAAIVAIPMLVNRLNPAEIITHPDLEIPTLVNLDDTLIPELPKPKPLEQQQAAAAPQTTRPTVELKPFEATTAPVAPTVTNDDLKTKLTAGVTTEGTGTEPVIGTVGPGTGTQGTGTSITPSVSGPGTIESIVDVAPEYPGGLDKFRRDVGSKFKTPEIENMTTIRVLVSFVVEPDGTLSNIKATRDPGYGLGAEAERVIKSLKAKWKPGMKGGKAVRTAYNLPITVKVN